MYDVISFPLVHNLMIDRMMCLTLFSIVCPNVLLTDVKSNKKINIFVLHGFYLLDYICWFCLDI